MSESGRHRLGEPPVVRDIPTGELRLTIDGPGTGQRSLWSDGPRGPLDRKLHGVLVEIERRIPIADADDERMRQAEARWAQEEEARVEAERARVAEQQRDDQLLREAVAWARASEIRRYVAALRERLAAIDEFDERERERLEAWCARGDELAARADPTSDLVRAGTGTGRADAQ
jgi:hypothetical protein